MSKLKCAWMYRKRANPTSTSNEMDEAAVAVSVALIVASGFLVLVFALVFDVAALYTERRTVQNAADFSANALAVTCAETANNPNSICRQSTNGSALGTVSNYANLNSKDNLTNAQLCGKGGLGACPTQLPGPFICNDVNTNLYPNWLRVLTDSQTDTAPYIVPYFSSLVDPSIKADVRGCANAAWGKAGSAPVVLPLGLPICDYQITGNKLITSFLSNSATQSCSVQDLNGITWSYPAATKGFAFFTNFSDNNGALTTLGCPDISDGKTLEVGNKLYYETSLSQVYASTCGTKDIFLARLISLVDKQERVFVPALTDVICSNGTNTNCIGSYSFKVDGFFAFQIKGFRFSNQEKYDPNNLISSSSCTGSTQCVFGEFVNAVVPGAPISTTPGPAVGAQAVELLP